MASEANVGSVSEAGMVTLFVELLRSGRSPWGGVGVLQEFGYLRGRTDVVVTTKDAVIAFEAKLTNWRRALDQAYRNTCFAGLSYVLLPPERAKFVMKYVGEFEERGIGLCCINNGQLDILYASQPREPVEPWLTEQARGLADA
jgi:hypothetical protein